ncbi:NAD-dependent epimerase/dehydratase family protein [Antarctobacter heliothermus]|uniref:NAD dependent epimerase/dehydratase family protein n=1 Tax=Antarctobacter heliothermus TaxID=74033 RepID=A0A239E1T0_9RHOB|nr:NAD-dependent epimerase/dehydratase family protein [Antarctobacter heliothermus]SNS38695.1 NAD dependent epimerase/dehydratase family protein [Antarctobacter heliothermus]
MGDVKPGTNSLRDVKPEPKNTGDVTRILITGANGFVGSACVAEARARGVEVIALYRRAPLAQWANDPGIHALQGDLSDPAATAPLRNATARVQAVIHAAAHLGGDAASHAQDTLRGTQTLLDTMADSGARLVLVSSIAVYDTAQIAPGAALDETAPLDDPDHPRDAYAGAKRRQELMCRASGVPLWILRPGAVWGSGRTWNALLGFWASKLHVQINSGGELPLTHVSHTAWALVEAAMRAPQGTPVLNVLDDDRPTRARFLRAHQRMTGWPRLTLPVPYRVWMAGVRLLKPLSPHLPGLLREPTARARLMPLTWPNTALRSALGGEDTDTFEGMLARTLGDNSP